MSGGGDNRPVKPEDCVYCRRNLPHAQHISALQAAQLGLVPGEVCKAEGYLMISACFEEGTEEGTVETRGPSAPYRLRKVESENPLRYVDL